MLFIRIFFPKKVMLYSHELLTYVRRVLIVFDWKMYAAQWHGKKAKTSIMFSHISWKWSFTTVLTSSNYPSWLVRILEGKPSIFEYTINAVFLVCKLSNLKNKLANYRGPFVESNFLVKWVLVTD